ncbi:hypothetical protein [Armatimonas sp.]|uniref:hypothetical protein n=1 Tax=Armatimonas sp. TaxID=1872638 RepID=UPI00286BB4DC|nr:hypothetical protein [Armatimonas sp.]
MEWFKSLFRQSRFNAALPTPQEPEINLVMQMVMTMTQKEWVEEQLTQCSIERMMEVSGIREAHIQSLRNAGITNLRIARERESLPLMGATNDWAQDWLRNFVSRLEREYRQHRRKLTN